jgi:hypothetical protein
MNHIFKALDDPTRREILNMLKEKDMNFQYKPIQKLDDNQSFDKKSKKQQYGISQGIIR